MSGFHALRRSGLSNVRVQTPSAVSYRTSAELRCWLATMSPSCSLPGRTMSHRRCRGERVPVIQDRLDRGHERDVSDRVAQELVYVFGRVAGHAVTGNDDAVAAVHGLDRRPVDRDV